MDSSKSIIETESVFLDELKFPVVRRLFWVTGLTKVIVLEAIKPGQRLWRWLLKRKGVYVFEASFFAGSLKNSDGESVRLAARRKAGEIALAAAKEIVKSEPCLQSLNEAYGRNTIRLFIAKQLHLDIEYWTVRALIAEALCTSGRAEIWIKAPTLFDGALLGNAIPGVDFKFYFTAVFGSLKLAISLVLDVAGSIKLTHGFRRHKRSPVHVMQHKPSVLTLQENSIRSDHSVRGQPHWVDVNNPSEIFHVYVVELLNSKLSFVEDESQLIKSGVKIIPTTAFRSALRAMRNDRILTQVRRDRRTALWATFRAYGFANKFFLLRVAYILRQAELMGALALWLNAKVFFVTETYYSYADAMQLVAPGLNVFTLACQYSNMMFVSPIMMSTADRLLIFSDMYKALYQTDGIAPQEFVTNGYLYDGIASLVREKAVRHREVLSRAGAKFIVCYFDESVHHNRWGFVNKGDHLEELHVLAEAVLNDPTFGVVLKSQFVFNSPDRIFSNDKILEAAKATGRFIELMEGIYRNDIYATEAALTADLCIGHKFGATAALEAAIAGVRTVLLNVHGAKTLWDSVYAKANIEFKSIVFLMKAIARYRSGNQAEQTLGDWTSILHFFDTYQDGKAVERLLQEITIALSNRP